ncbi:hypothetical protein DM860_012849 [Cuscuta australis]|uniref:Uncharacterized protein n=1 Tax=Cuscuta australis TaxID=267555 RepID=A0A328DVT3_9ASTE|nr:hypothetical protein DM860_012849 [Cuscuta australis]
MHCPLFLGFSPSFDLDRFSAGWVWQYSVLIKLPRFSSSGIFSRSYKPQLCKKPQTGIFSVPRCGWFFKIYEDAVLCCRYSTTE